MTELFAHNTDGNTAVIDNDEMFSPEFGGGAVPVLALGDEDDDGLGEEEAFGEDEEFEDDELTEDDEFLDDEEDEAFGDTDDEEAEEEEEDDEL